MRRPGRRPPRVLRDVLISVDALVVVVLLVVGVTGIVAGALGFGGWGSLLFGVLLVLYAAYGAARLRRALRR